MQGNFVRVAVIDVTKMMQLHECPLWVNLLEVIEGRLWAVSANSLRQTQLPKAPYRNYDKIRKCIPNMIINLSTFYPSISVRSGPRNNTYEIA